MMEFSNSITSVLVKISPTAEHKQWAVICTNIHIESSDSPEKRAN